MSDGGLGKVLVTGGGGFLGSALVGFARARGLEVRSLARRFYPRLQDLGVEQIQGDVADASAVDRAVDGCQTVFHTAAKAGLWGLARDYERVERRGNQERDRGLPIQGRAADHFHQLAQRGFQRPGDGGGR